LVPLLSSEPKKASAGVESNTAAPAPPSAVLEIQTNPAFAFSIYVDDQLRGVTDHIRIPSLAPGRHRLRLDRAGYQRDEETVELIGGLNKKTITLVPVITSGGPNAATVSEGSVQPGTTFEVFHLHGTVPTSAKGSLGLDNGNLVYHESGSHAHSDHDFRVACSEIREVKANSFWGRIGFHVTFRSKNYNFFLSDSGHRSYESIVAEILAACGQR
jgi:hypothetical protein